MASSRSPNINYNGSGYTDPTARDAICKADRELLKIRRLQIEHGFREHREDARTPKAAFRKAKSAE